MNKIYAYVVVFSMLFFQAFNNLVLAESSNLIKLEQEKVQQGRVAFIKASEAKIIELDLNGNKTWEFQIPGKYQISSHSMSAGPDIEWLEATNSFLLVIPKVGVIEVNRQGKIVWEYMTKDISHDVDLLSDGTLVFVNGWDSDTDYVLTRINRNGEILERYKADEIGLKKEDRRWNDNIPGRAPEKYSNTHANAVQDLGNGRFLVSLRNYHRAVVIKNGKIIRSYNQAKLIHDPIDVGDKLFFVRHESVGESRLIMHDKSTNKRSPLFITPDASWTPLRTIEVLNNGNFLVTGSTVITQLTKDGEIVWQVDLLNFDGQILSKRNNRDFIYKAAFVYK